MNTNTKTAIKDSALAFLSNIVATKEKGGELPPVLDKIAGLTIKGKATAQNMAIEAAKEESKKQFPWVLVIVLSLALIIMLYKANR